MFGLSTLMSCTLITRSFLVVLYILIKNSKDFSGGPVVKTLPSNPGGAGLISGWELRSHICCGQKNKNIKQKQYCNKFNKNFKNGSHQ